MAFLLVLSASAPSLASTISWFCDGRLCGTLTCCCDQPELQKNDTNCRKVVADTNKPSLCQAGCGCTSVITAANEQSARPASSLALPSLALYLPVPAPAPVLTVLYLPTAAVRLPDYRGPPVVFVSFPPSGLRAPPAS